MHDQLVLDYKHKVLFCLVEKNGNTNVRMMFLIAAGLVPETESYAARSRSLFGKDIRKYTSKIVASNVELTSGETVESLLPQLFKMTIVRHPLERLLSGYRNKVEGVIQRDKKIKDPFSNEQKLDVFKTVHPDMYKQWLNNKSMEYNVSFSDFIQFVIKKPNVQLNIHYRPVINLCSPCTVKYNFYGSFNQFNQDTEILVTKLGSKLEKIPGANHGRNATAVNVNTYYSQLSQDLKEQLFRDWYRELEFYYYLYPEERNSHKLILNIDEDIPVDLTGFSLI